MCEYLPACMTAPNACSALRNQKRKSDPQKQVTDGWEMLYGFWEPVSGLQEQQVLLAAELFLQMNIHSLNKQKQTNNPPPKKNPQIY